ncbi:MAG TPA: ribosome silencing factor [Alphaproteobacteria bacterium]|nr:ribosome silencing factor [Alphaproteobacteria bacterium]
MARGKRKPSAPAEALCRLIERSLEDDKAIEPVVISLAKKSALADFMIVASGTSQRQVGAMAEHLAKKLKAAGIGAIHVEGKSQGDWVLVDAGDVIVHLFRPEFRALYNLEKMWGRATTGSDHAVELIA